MFDFVSFFPRAVMQGIPLLFGATGETLTEKSGNLNLGIPGIMYVGGICGVIGAFFYEQSGSVNGLLAVLIPLVCCLLGSLLMGLLYCFLTVTLRANQNVTGLAMTTFGVGFGNFFGGSLIKLTGSEVPSIALSTTSAYFSRSLPIADKLGVFGKLFLSYGFLAYTAIILALISSYVLKKTRVGLQLRAVGGLNFRLSPRSFYQVNHDQAQRLYETAISQAGITKSDTVLDLYCGVGTITLAMAGAAGKVIGVEVVPQAVEDAKDNARRNGIENAEFFCGDAGQAALALEAQGVHPDVAVVDPPRKGLNADTIEALSRMAPRRIVYVSCDPATLSRDVALLKERGYALRSATAADLFPRCAHVESIVLLSKLADDHMELEIDPLELEKIVDRVPPHTPKLSSTF